MTKPRMLAILATLLLAGAGLVWAQTSTPTSSEPPVAPMAGSMMGGGGMMGGSGAQGSMMGGRGFMMGAQGSMMAPGQGVIPQTEAIDARLERLVAAMNDARGEQKVDAVAAVVGELVAEREALNQTLAAMQPGMMMRMMQHMPMGGMHGMSGTMQHGMTPGEQDGPGDHASHH